MTRRPIPILLIFPLLGLLSLLAACGVQDSPAAISTAALPPAPPTFTREATRVPTAVPSRTALPQPTPSVPEPTITPLVTSTSATLVTSAPDSTNAVTEPLDTRGSFACAGSAGNGLTCLTASGQWRSFKRDSSPLGGDYIFDIDVCDDGRMLIMHSSGVSIFDGRDWSQVAGGWGFGSPSAIACAGPESFWVSHFQGVSHFDGQQWRNYSAAELAFGEEATDLVVDIAAGDDGRIWALTANSIAAFDGRDWTVFQVGQGIEEKHFYDAMTVDQDGRPWVAHSNGLLTYDDERWELVQNRDIYTLQDIAVDRQGKKWVGTFSQGLAVFDESTWRYWDRLSGSLDSNHVNQIKVDENGRIWVGTAWGLHIFDGQVWHRYRMDSADILDNNIQTLGIVGSPRLPEAQTWTPGSLSGDIVEDALPLAGARVEICVEPLGSYFTGETPCAAQPFKRGAVTDDAGYFLFSDLPPGYYVLAVETADGWKRLTPGTGVGSERVLVRSAAESALGTLTVRKEG